MGNEIVNTPEYWDERFSGGSWDTYDGESQSAFFAELAIGALPGWMKELLQKNTWTVTDLGCAEGAGTAAIARHFPNCRITGVDFSAAAVNTAREKYPFCDFKKGDIRAWEDRCDVVFSSNTLEHMSAPRQVMENMTRCAARHLILLLPLRDTTANPEHFSVFDEGFFPLDLAGFELTWFREIDCGIAGTPFWPGEQILLIYSAPGEIPEGRTLEELFTNREYASLKAKWEAQRAAAAALETETGTLREQLLGAEKKLSLCEEHLRSTESELSAARAAAEDLHAQMEISRREREQTLRSLREAETALSERENRLNDCETLLTETEEALSAGQSELKKTQNALTEKERLLEETYGTLAERTREREELAGKLQDADRALTRVRDGNAALAGELKELSGHKIYRLAHFLNRLHWQLFKGSRADRRAFWKWLFGHFAGKVNDDRRYNPLFSVIHRLERPVPKITAPDREMEVPQGQLEQHLAQRREYFARIRSQLSPEAEAIRARAANRDYKGILIYPHTVYWEPLQTPQQLLRAFAAEGWLCYFCESDAVENARREVEPNLFIVYEQDLVQALARESVHILLTWMGSDAFVEQFENRQVWYHLLDHPAIFAYYDEAYERLHEDWVNKAQTVSYVAGPLTGHLPGRPDAVYLPNAVNAGEIIDSQAGPVPEDLAPILGKGHPVVGYYGYLAEWMDYDLVRTAALARPEVEFVFVGSAIHDTSAIDTLPNVHLLGLKPYAELPAYARRFDAAMIPFRVDEKMDCVSPIKFYEYMAYGLPVTASSMRELDPFAERFSFVSCADDARSFLRGLDRSLRPEVKAQAREQGPAAAMENDWRMRACTMIPELLRREEELRRVYDKADVIVLSIIDWGFRRQRPQHLARLLAEAGHRVFYVNAGFAAEYAQRSLGENLWEIRLADWGPGSIHLTDGAENPDALRSGLDAMTDRFMIRDAAVVAEYPNWVNAAEYLRNHYGFAVVTDYMDDFGGFTNPVSELVRTNCLRLLTVSDSAVASSRFLYDAAEQYCRNVHMIRNGTEFEYFHSAADGPENTGSKKIIGYYGAIADWFNTQVVCRCAERFPQHEIVLVGEVSANRKKLERFGNIRLVGEVPYDQLLPWLASFDVCLIPFDTSTDLIRATNPVKFYEYLSAGKKIVATRIPELEPYDGRFVYLENDPDRFCDRVEQCLADTDTLADREERFAFARENDWCRRAEAFDAVLKEVWPKISIIVLCYNNLAYTKLCIDSILTRTAYPNYELIAVDNASKDDTANWLRQIAAADPRVRPVFNDTNRGFAGGNNDGMAVSAGDYVVLLNNDTVVTRGWLTNLLKHFRRDPSTGLVGPVTNSIGNEARIPVSYSTLREMPLFAYDYTARHMGEEYPHRGVLAMFCVMISREVLNAVGPLDENFGIGMFEDDDYCLAAKKLGYRLVMAEDVFIQHFESVSFKTIRDDRRMELYERNRKYFETKWNTRWTPHQHRPETEADAFARDIMIEEERQ